MAKKSRDKGARGERAVVSVLRRCFPDIRRGRQYDSARECDVEGTPFRLEVKLRKAMTYSVVEKALAQCREDGVEHLDKRPTLGIFKRDNGPFIFAGYLEDLVLIVETLFYKDTKEDADAVIQLFGDK